MNSYGPPVMSIFRSAGLKTRIDQDIQIGLPCLPSASSDEYLGIIRSWVEICDFQHKDSTCQQLSRGSSASSSYHRRLPTRVISVGTKGDPTVKLLETTPSDIGEWVALSHQWGRGPQFSTTRQNLPHHIQGIRMDQLPATFRDAVTVTRALGRPYLWIDSLCVIQGKDGDFDQEAKRMEQVYSGAYCVLAASRSPGHYAGFLQPRQANDSVTMQRDGDSAPFYIREAIDDFQQHVLEGGLNQRGWVLQEHALARRTVYFTDYQTYFECGNGVHCETMTKMTNDLAAFLGDPNFPRIIMGADQGEKILRYQDLYKRYSRLGLSNPSDRAVAINGLQERILHALGVEGGFGVFFEDTKDGRGRGLLRRSLLWCRASDTIALSRVYVPDHRTASKAPSWSWMAYTGGIDYIAPNFGDMDWEEIQSPWDAKPGLRDDMLLVAAARDYETDDEDGNLVFDDPESPAQLPLKCVVLGKQKGRTPVKEKLHYLLVVQERNGRYERVGAGYLPGRCIHGTAKKIIIH
ncbi:hypothetical protein CEP54_002997 [Fusarium duplospermum]|uniref:Heterokaryon incompatibility domain-containing protein n=1 Tax=Fusarium duplospermum TaxID=1325734 RepID=A0A428QRT7_9HYPO|nr:hypothetical protein CEP54_002997 [Fusarium duplospermum]